MPSYNLTSKHHILLPRAKSVQPLPVADVSPLWTYSGRWDAVDDGDVFANSTLHTAKEKVSILLPLPTYDRCLPTIGCQRDACLQWHRVLCFRRRQCTRQERPI